MIATTVILLGFLAIHHTDALSMPDSSKGVMKIQQVVHKNVHETADRIAAAHHKYHRSLLIDNDDFCGIFEDAFVDANSPQGACSCEASDDFSVIAIHCEFQDICDDTHQVGGKPVCASKLTTNYTIDVSNEDDGTMSTHACVDMSNPDLPEYCIKFDFAFSDLDDFSDIEFSATCEATVGGKNCVCNIDTDFSTLCPLEIDCSDLVEGWPDQSCSELDMSGGNIETTSFLLTADSDKAKDGTTSGGTVVQFGVLAIAAAAVGFLFM